jgi:hypothetical protein
MKIRLIRGTKQGITVAPIVQPFDFETSGWTFSRDKINHTPIEKPAELKVKTD